MLKEAINRLKFTISKGNKPADKDVQAFNEVCSLLQKIEAKTIHENLLFAKLYAFVLGELTRHYNDIDAANKELNSILSEPISLRIEMLQMALKEMELRNLFNRQEFKDPFLKGEKMERLQDIAVRYLDANELASVLDQWDKDNIYAHLTTNINLSIQNFKNNV